MEILTPPDTLQADMAAVDALIDEGLHSDVPLIGEIGRHLINSGGKRLRPRLLLLSAKALGYTGTHHHKLAAVIEFVHTATLLHDDVVDNSSLRRGQPSANTLWGNNASVLVGDFMYSRAFEFMVDVQDLTIFNVLAKATNVISEGEVFQLSHCRNTETTEADYFKIIRAKTAALFSAGTEVGARLATDNADQIQALTTYGLQLGIAFQLIDDVLDYTGDSATIGKNVGDDLAEGKPTLPLLHVLHNGTASQRALIEGCIRESSVDQIDNVIEVVSSTEAIRYTQQKAEAAYTAAVAALKVIPESEYTQTLRELADFSVKRVV